PADPGSTGTLRGTLDLYAVAQRRERWERKHPAEGQAPGDGQRRVSLPGEAVTVALFPDDAKLGTLGHLFEADARTRLLRDLLPGRPDLRAGPVGTLAYKPQRRYVGRLLGPDGPLVLKVCAAKDYAATVATARALGSRGPRSSRTGSPPASETPPRRSMPSTATSTPSRFCWTAAGWASSTSTRRRAATLHSIWGGSSRTSDVPPCGTVSRRGTS